MAVNVPALAILAGVAAIVFNFSLHKIEEGRRGTFVIVFDFVSSFPEPAKGFNDKRTSRDPKRQRRRP